ncbi:MAG: putative DNA binding domain-containing protein [Elusimicrobia bacterium]|nr:putative DNA binding domain-containing protein [Candidatus Obscuribacterium magneticum]MCB4756349.1 putative DNA binding domain-containing protein [Candidatus Obscuribacterium magneticum]
MMKPWIETARKYLEASLHPIPHELNELDWKAALSEKNESLCRHISAFANQRGGGYFVFGIASNAQVKGVGSQESKDIVTRIANLAREGLEPPQLIDHFSDGFQGKTITFVYVRESEQKPVHLRGQGLEGSYIRSGGQTRKMSRHEVANAVLSSRQIRFEELEARPCQRNEVLTLLDHERLVQLLGLTPPESEESLLELLVNQKLVYRNGPDYSISNLGVMVSARDLRQFPGKERFPVRVVKYKGHSRMEAEVEKEFPSGYGVGFQDVIRFILSQLPTSEIIKDALRKDVPIYPEITIRELVANALIHRDCTITATNPMIEIFLDRIEILNPGTLLPSIKIERIIDSAPESRNEIFASFMRRLGICEERGSGIDKALFAIEVYGLPPVEFVDGPNAFKAILHRPRNFKQMTTEERLRACYQHCCLKFVSNDKMTNASFRQRLGLRESQSPQAWKTIDSAVKQGLIKPGDPLSKSRKYAHYLPFWA